MVEESHQRDVLNISLKIRPIELWFLAREEDHAEEGAQILKMKFENEVNFSTNQLSKQLLCTKSRQMIVSHSVNQLKLAGLAETVTKIMERDMSIKVKLANISLEEEVFESWDKAVEVLESDPARQDVKNMFATSKMLEPTDILIDFQQR